MPIARADETDLLIPLYEGVHEVSPWRLFLARLRQRLRASEVAIVMRHEERVVRFSISGARVLPLLDPWLAGLRRGRVYTASERGDDPGRAAAERVVRADEPGGASAWLMAERSGRDFSAADGALLAALAPHLAVAIRTLGALDRGRMRDVMSAVALERGGVGWVALSRDARVLAISGVAATMFGDVSGERLVAGSAIGREAALAIAGFCLSPAGVLAVAWGDETPAAVLLLPPPADAVATMAPVAAIGLVMVRPRGDSATRAAILAALHGLAPSEARFAAAIASGASLANAAAALGLTIETARNYSKRVYAKTRTVGQVDLVRMVGESVVRLG